MSYYNLPYADELNSSVEGVVGGVTGSILALTLIVVVILIVCIAYLKKGKKVKYARYQV